jgi:hypothetical protein
MARSGSIRSGPFLSGHDRDDKAALSRELAIVTI